LICTSIAYINSLEGSNVTGIFHKFRNYDDYGSLICLFIFLNT